MLDTLVQLGVNWIVAIQLLGGWLEAPMKFFSFLGSENFFFLTLPLIYWSIDAGLGLRVAVILIASNSLKPVFKMFFAGPRPYWVSPQVKAFVAEGSFGVPSGHAQDAVALWGMMASGARRRWAWIAAFTLAFLIGFSRLYLGVHFVHDVLAGWLIGGLLLWAFLRFWDPAAAWLQTKSFGQQVLIAFLLSLLVIALGALVVGRLDGYTLPAEWRENALRAGELPDPVSMEGTLTSAGTLFGLAVGVAWLATRGGYQTSGPVAKRALRYVIGLVGVLLFWKGLDFVFPSGEDFIGFIFRYLRYSLVGLWISAGAPYLFFHFKLASKPKM